MIDLSVVVPIYNEEKNIIHFLERLKKVLSKITNNYEIIFCLDPSFDKSKEILINETKKDKKIKLIVFSRRFGQPLATFAGIENSTGERCVIIDCDLQDPPEVIEDLYNKMSEGYDVVTAKRILRDGESIIKKIITKIGYKILNKISDVEIPEDVGDFRIISKKIVYHLKKMQESSAFLRGLVSYVGFKHCSVLYHRKSRLDGDSKYNKYFGSIKIAFNGLFGFSSKPLFLMSILGFCFSVFSFFIGAYYFLIKIFNFSITPGLSSTVIIITFFSGINLLALGLLGEYIGRIYDEVKNRPKYIVDEKYNLDD